MTTNNNQLLDELVAVHLRYTAVSNPLRTRAMAQLAAKVLYSKKSDEEINAEKIGRGICKILRIPKLSIREVEDALTLLEKINLVVKTGCHWELTEDGKKRLEEDLSRTRSLTNSIIERHFPQTIPQQQIKDWFVDTCIEYFGHYGSYWVASICRTSPYGASIPSSWRGIIPAIAKKHAIDQYDEALTGGFERFIESEDQRDQEYRWNLGQAMFASRLIAARVGSDPITIREIKDSLVFLDTNILLVAALETHRHAKSLALLGKALKTLNMKPVVLPDTKNEYERVVYQSKRETLRVVSRYPKEISERASDNFTRTAIARGCVTTNDFERFFDSVRSMPKGLDSEKIELCSEQSIINSAIIGAKDRNIQNQVASIWKSLRHNDKPESAIIHDSALLKVVEDTISKGKKCLVLTTDHTMSLLSGRRAGPHGLPSWVTLDTLLQILAIDDSGVQIKAENFGPLMTAVLENEAQPSPGTYTTQDLAWLLDIEERCADLPPEKIKTCTLIVTQARLSGRRRNDPELQLEIQRAFQGNRMDLASEVSMAKADLAATKKELNQEVSATKNLREAFINEKKKSIRKDAFLEFSWKTALTTVWGAACITFSIWFSKHVGNGDSLFLTLGIPALIFFIGVVSSPLAIWRYFSKLKKSLNSAEEIAKEQAEKMDDKTKMQ